jgi:ComF family protein
MFERLLQWVFPDECVGCGKRGGLLCAGCLGAAPLYTNGLPCVGARRVFIRYEYVDTIRAALLLLKYCGKRRIAHAFADALVPILPTDYAAVIALPAAPLRISQRGYDQAVLLAQAVARRLGVRYCVGLVRTRDTTAQAHLTRLQRAANVAGAFGWHGEVPNGRVLLVDDICTTGATLREAIHALHACGIQDVDVAVIARGHTK